jgi:hypothetical protein
MGHDTDQVHEAAAQHSKAQLLLSINGAHDGWNTDAE